MSTAKRSGRRPGDPEVTKQSILSAAREVFGEVGFDRATIRSIAARAEVDPALVHHHFGTKHDLFASAHALAINPAQLVALAGSVPRDQIAATIVRLYLEVLGGPGSTALSLIRAAATNESAARMLREYITSVLIENAPSLTDLPDAKLRVSLVGSHMIGLIFAMRVIELPELAGLSNEELLRFLTPVIDGYLNDADLWVG